MGNRVKLPLVCQHCGQSQIVALRSKERVLIRCEGCERRIFAYYSDHREPEPPPTEDDDLVREVERALLNEVPAPARGLYEYLRRFNKAHGYAPTLRETARALGWASPSTVSHYLERLERCGLIERDYGTSRAIRLPYAA